MATIGRITIPETAPSTTFPLRTDFAHGMTIGRTVVAHSFADGSEQRFHVGAPATRYSFVRQALPRSARATLAAFWQATQGCVLPFSYAVPQQDGGFLTKTVRFENTPLSLQDLTNAISSVGVTFVEIPDPSGAPVYVTSATVTRFPDATLTAALLQEVQEIVPLVRVRVLDSAVPDILLSDRYVTLTTPTIPYTLDTVTPKADNETFVDVLPFTFASWLNPANGAQMDGAFLPTQPCDEFRVSLAAGRTYQFTVASQETDPIPDGITFPLVALWYHDTVSGTDTRIVGGSGAFTWTVPAGADASTRLVVYYDGAPVTQDFHYQLAIAEVVTPDQVYQPRLLRVGDPSGDVLVEQKIDGSSDDVQFTFGNADRVMIALANDTELIGARVELSLFHVASLRKLDLWAGDVIDWGSDTGPEFTVRCSDHLSALTLSSPVGTCSRTCWRRYGQDGCPATPGTQAMDATHFASADATNCDQGYETANGCLAHSGGPNPTKYSYGGVWAKPQQVRVQDNSTGMKGIGRATITPTSQISDSIWGQTIPEIWHSDDGIPQRALPVTCRIAAGREESDFYIALGVVGKGPLGAFSAPTMIDEDGDGVKETFIGSTLDGQPHHGWTADDNGNPTGNSLGLRQTLGTDPAGANDFFSLGRVGTAPTSWREVVGGASCYEDTYAAGVAICEIRRTDQKGVQLSAVDSHAMIVMISQGLSAWIWDGSGVRSASPGCTNPVWVAINTYLRAIGLADADADIQVATFDVGAAVAAAATADELVASLFGDTSVANPSAPNTDEFTLGYDPQSEFCLSHAPIELPSVTVGDVAATVSLLPDASGQFTWDGASNLVEATSPVEGYADVAITYVFAETYTTVMGAEKQFRFKGTVDPTKPTRDWLRDILNNCLGYFTWSFGTLKIGCRNTSTPVSAFVPGNILFNSLRLDPIKPGFEKLTIDFADEEYQFAHNTVVFTDQDYAARHGRVANPRASEFGLVGSSTKSQAMRVAVCRTREELGGVGDTEQKQARNGFWRSTVLALDVEAGAVVSLADAELAGGSGTFRLQSWRLNRDWSVDLVGKTVRASMYDLTAGAIAPTVTAPTPPPAGVRDSGPPPTPTFAAQISPVDPTSLQLYDLAFAQTSNTRTIVSATFTITFSGGAAPMVQSASFPQDFFSSSAASVWSLKISLPGKTVTDVSCFVTNAYGNSGVYDLAVGLTLSSVALTGTTGDAAVFGAGGKLVDGGAPPILFGGGSQATGHLLAFDASGNAVDAGAPGGRAVGATFDGGGSTLAAGLTAYVKLPFAATLAAWSILVDAGTCTIKVWKVAAGAAIPVSGNSINTSGVSIGGGTAAHSADLTDFTTTAFAAGDIVGIHLAAVTGATQAVFELEFTL